jgi:hypothetical protein
VLETVASDTNISHHVYGQVLEMTARWIRQVLQLLATGTNVRISPRLRTTIPTWQRQELKTRAKWRRQDVTNIKCYKQQLHG